MKSLIACASLLALVGLTGCGQKATIKKETTVTSPGGTTKTTTTQEIEKTGDNPPPSQP